MIKTVPGSREIAFRRRGLGVPVVEFDMGAARSRLWLPPVGAARICCSRGIWMAWSTRPGGEEILGISAAAERECDRSNVIRY